MKTENGVVRWVLTVSTALLLHSPLARAQVPQLLNYQGRIAVNGTNFTGTGEFKFALVSGSTNASMQATASGTVIYGFLVNITVNNGGSGYSTPPAVTITDSTGAGAAAYTQISGGVVTNIVVTSAGFGYSSSPAIVIATPPEQNVFATFWSNDGSSNAGGQPATSVPLPVTKGLYSVLLGDTTLSNMSAIPAAVFTNADVRLRAWFNDLGKIIESEWALFAERLPESVAKKKREFGENLTTLNGIRNKVMHPVRSAPPSEEDLKFVKRMQETLHLSKWRKRGDKNASG